MRRVPAGARRSVWAAVAGTLLVFGLASCDLPAVAPKPSHSPCPKVALPAPAPVGPPVALLQSAAAGAFEYLAGSPGSRLTRLTAPHLTGLPHLAAGRIFYTAYQAGHTRVMVAAPSACARQVAVGALDLVDPTGRLVTVIDVNHRRLVDVATGRVLLPNLAPGTYAFTNDGRLVGADAKQVTLYGDGGAARVVVNGYYQVLGTLGPNQVLLGTATATSALDVDSGKLWTIAGSRLTTAAGSPDGRWVAVEDAAGGRLLSLTLGGGPSAEGPALPAPGPVLGLLWSADSAWLAIDSPFGGDVVHATDGRSLDLGSDKVLSW